MNFDMSFQTILITLVSIVVSLSIHEASHALMSLKLGDTTAHELGRVSLNPLRHIDPLTTILLPLITLIAFQAPILAAKPVPFNPDRVKFDEFGAALVGFAGPASNLLLAIVGVFMAKFVGGPLTETFFLFTWINIGLFVFNMVPIPPLDGSRVLFAFAPEWLQRIMMQIEPFGVFVVFAMVLAVPGFSSILLNVNHSILQFLFRL